ncbi:hypothetical protein PO878_12060 [Iamia majanohamensis]|uniref:Uncharacterized protein n=1 Tax=Iamia majanohamensis TaxID=467976 RepID=A0AAE9Y6J4_9ACTN|nr:hypothetical protein [Iamia majanohamensis]WCO65233.1 hypothetical protein PO878_12060 [Iamia majanohamensis]
MAAVRRSPLGLVAGLVALAGALVLAGALALAPTPAAAAPAATPVACDAAARAAGGVGVAVSFPGRSLFTACVDPGGTGIDVLRRAGLAPVVQGYGSVGGGAVCALTDPRSGEQVGCAAGPSCLVCQEPRSWSYYQGYRYSQVGAGSTRPAAGGVEAWQWGTGTSWSASRVYDMCAPTPPPSTAPPTTAPPATGPPAGGGAGTATPRPGGDAPGPTPAPPEGGGAAGTPTTAPPPGDAGPGGATTTRPPGSSSSSSSTTTTAPATTTTEAGDAVADPEGDRAAADEADGAAPGDGDERAQGAPEGTMAVTEGDDGGGGALVPVAGTAGLVGLLSVVAVRARRRRAAAPDEA